MQILLVIIILILLGVFWPVAGAVAAGIYSTFSFVIWFVGIFFVLLIAFSIWSVRNQERREAEARAQIERETKRSLRLMAEAQALDLAAQKTCPDCAETIKVAASVCRFCGHRFAEGDDSSPEPKPAPEPAIPSRPRLAILENPGGTFVVGDMEFAVFAEAQRYLNLQQGGRGA